MFIGDVPAGFYWEVVLRIAVIYLVLMVSMRLMGKRMASQLGRNEMIALVSLAAAIGVPLQAPDRGIVAAVVIAAVVVYCRGMITSSHGGGTSLPTGRYATPAAPLFRPRTAPDGAGNAAVRI